MFRCSHTIIRERINSCLLKLQLLKQSIKIHQFLVNTVVVWLHILGPYWCVCVLHCSADSIKTFRRWNFLLNFSTPYI